MMSLWQWGIWCRCGKQGLGGVDMSVLELKEYLHKNYSICLSQIANVQYKKGIGCEIETVAGEVLCEDSPGVMESLLDWWDDKQSSI